MKKAICTIAIILSVIILFFIGLPQQALAKSDPFAPTPAIEAVDSGIANGSWQIKSGEGTEVDITSAASTAPGWLQLLSTNGVSMSIGGQICHPLRGGQFGWVGQIRMLKDGEWVKVPTVNGWVPDKEGAFMACAEIEAAGTYALFGYFVAPE